MYYTGIGSRKTPKDIQEVMTKVATYLEGIGFILRSGAADGADSSFETGVLDNKNKEIYLPWKGFQSSQSNLIVEDKRAFEMAKEFHPNWEVLKQGAKKLHARNTHQILGKTLDTPSLFVICYTAGGTGKGGTGQALRLAKEHRIPIFDFGKYTDIDQARKELFTFIKVQIRTLEKETKYTFDKTMKHL